VPSGMLAEIFGVDGIIVIVVVAIVLLFGGSQLPKLARGLGSASHEFKKGMEEGEVNSDAPADTPAPAAIPAPAAVQPATPVGDGTPAAEDEAPQALPAATDAP